MRYLTIFLADDHCIVRNGLRLLLEAQPDFKIIGEASTGREAVSKILEKEPDIVILDIAMPDLNGIEATWQIRETNPSVQIIILSMYSSQGHITRALQAGVRGYVLKSSVATELIEAIRAVRAGHRYLSEKVSDLVIHDYLSFEKTNIEVSPLTQLSSQEQKILKLVVEGNTSVQIAKTLSISPNTVDTYRSRIMYKLNVKDVPNLVKFAIQHGVTSLE